MCAIARLYCSAVSVWLGDDDRSRRRHYYCLRQLERLNAKMPKVRRADGGSGGLVYGLGGGEVVASYIYFAGSFRLEDTWFLLLTFFDG